jgi:hypothetical protein
MSVTNHWEIFCVTESAWINQASENAPSTCPTDALHTVRENSVRKRQSECLDGVGYIEFRTTDDPGNPPAGYVRLFKNNVDSNLYMRFSPTGYAFNIARQPKDSQVLSLSNEISTTSSSYIDMEGMTGTTNSVETMRYMIIFNAAVGTTNGASVVIDTILNINGNDVPSSLRSAKVPDNSTMAIITLVMGAVIPTGIIVKVRWKGTGAFTKTATNRNLIVNGQLA